jgi:glycosyltransferase involved in cell wall biosynthesis
MHIVYHHRTFADGAEGIHIREIAGAFEALGHTVSMAAPQAAAGAPRADAKPIEDLPPLARFRARLPSFVFRLAEIAYNVVSYLAVRREIRRRRPAFVYERYACFNIGGVLAARHAGVPTILEVNTPYAIARHGFEHLHFERIARWIERLTFEKAAALITVSTALRNMLVDAGVNADKITVIPNAINAAHFTGTADGGSIRARYGLGDAVVVGFLGSMRAWHGIDLLIDIVPEVLARAPQCRFLIVGAGELYEPLKAQVVAAGCGASVTFTGAVPHDQVQHFIDAMDVPVMPNSNTYGSPMKVFEYMALGRPTVAPRLGPLEEVITDGVTGVLVVPGDRRSLQEAIAGLVANAERRQAIGAAAQAVVFARHTWIENARRTLDIYEALRRGRIGDAVTPAVPAEARPNVSA